MHDVSLWQTSHFGPCLFHSLSTFLSLIDVLRKFIFNAIIDIVRLKPVIFFTVFCSYLFSPFSFSYVTGLVLNFYFFLFLFLKFHTFRYSLSSSGIPRFFRLSFYSFLITFFSLSFSVGLLAMNSLSSPLYQNVLISPLFPNGSFHCQRILG